MILQNIIFQLMCNYKLKKKMIQNEFGQQNQNDTRKSKKMKTGKKDGSSELVGEFDLSDNLACDKI